jgi:lysosomal alpha-glucosidase
MLIYKVFSQTICPSAKQALGSHYDLHNLYGYSEGIATHSALKTIRNKRPFIITRSTFPGYGHFGGHWTGDIVSEWTSLHDSITGKYIF